MSQMGENITHLTLDQHDHLSDRLEYNAKFVKKKHL